MFFDPFVKISMMFAELVDEENRLTTCLQGAETSRVHVNL